MRLMASELLVLDFFARVIDLPFGRQFWFGVDEETPTARLLQ